MILINQAAAWSIRTPVHEKSSFNLVSSSLRKHAGMEVCPSSQQASPHGEGSPGRGGGDQKSLRTAYLVSRVWLQRESRARSSPVACREDLCREGREESPLPSLALESSLLPIREENPPDWEIMTSLQDATIKTVISWNVSDWSTPQICHRAVRLHTCATYQFDSFSSWKTKQHQLNSNQPTEGLIT